MSAVVRRAAPSQIRGLTVIEFMMVLLVMSVLAAVAMPAYQDSQRRARVSSISSELSIAVAEARSLAMANRVAVSVVPKGGDWNNGWQITGPNPRETSFNDLSKYQVSLAGNKTAQDGINFNASGRLAAGVATAAITVCSASTEGREFSINALGRMQSKKIAAGC